MHRSLGDIACHAERVTHLLSVGTFHVETDLGAAAGEDSKTRFGGGDIRCDLIALDPRGRPRLDEDRLPNAARARVPPPLLADWLLRVVHRVFDPDHDRSGELTIFTDFERIGEVELEGDETAFVAAEVFPIAPAIGK